MENHILGILFDRQTGFERELRETVGGENQSLLESVAPCSSVLTGPTKDEIAGRGCKILSVKYLFFFPFPLEKFYSNTS